MVCTKVIDEEATLRLVFRIAFKGILFFRFKYANYSF